MSEGGYRIWNQEGVHFVTFAMSQWVDVFSRKCYRDILLEIVRYCQEHKGMLIHAWCVMTNHVHLVFSPENGDSSGLLRDFKKFTSQAIIKAIENNKQESRREWMLRIFLESGSDNSRNEKYQF